MLPNIGTYEVNWQVSVDEEGQLELWLDSGSGAVALPQTVVGRNTGLCQIVGNTLIATSHTNSILSVRNPNSDALLIPPFGSPIGGSLKGMPVSATLTIKRIA